MDEQLRPASGPPSAAADHFVIPRLVIAGVLLAAAALKILQLSTEPLVGSGFLANRWVNLLEADFEIVLGLWLLSGWHRRLAWLLTLACFLAFSGMAVSKYLEGEASCGCFGAMQVPPLATLTLDVSLVLLLVFLRPRRQPAAAPQRRRMVAAAAVAALVVMASAIPVARYSPARLAPDGTLIGTERIVLLEPEAWVGLPLPLGKHIDIAEALGRGEWIVVLVHHGCGGCKAVVAELAGRARAVGPGWAAKIALIQLPPYGNSMKEWVADDALFLNGRLDESRDWSAPTPVILRLRDGQVVDVRIAQTKATRKAALAAVVPVIQVADAEHDFGLVAAGSGLAVTFRIRNRGPGSIAIGSMVSDAPCLTVKSGPKRIAAHSFGLVEVEFVMPRGPSASRSARVVLGTDDPARPTIALTVRAETGR